MEQLNLDAGLNQVNAEKDICEEYGGAIKRILRALCGGKEEKEEKEEKTYSFGDRFSHPHSGAILTFIGDQKMLMAHSNGYCSGCEGGFRVADKSHITEAELIGICDGNRRHYTLEEAKDE